jgi:hypothetical protein
MNKLLMWGLEVYIEDVPKKENHVDIYVYIREQVMHKLGYNPVSVFSNCFVCLCNTESLSAQSHFYTYI